MSYKVAIIEDDEAIAEMYRIKFETEGYEVSTAYNGVTGLALAEKMHPDIVLLDIMMPEMSGDVMLAKLRQTDWGKDIRVIVLTNISEDEIPKDVFQLNVDRVIVKANHTPASVTGLINDVMAGKPEK